MSRYVVIGQDNIIIISFIWGESIGTTAIGWALKKIASTGKKWAGEPTVKLSKTTDTYCV